MSSSAFSEKDLPFEKAREDDEVNDKLGCTPSEAVEHLAKSGKHGETWDDYGVQVQGGDSKCHIDHIMPLSTVFNSTDEEAWRRITHWSNIQLLWADLNMTKGDTIPKDWKWNENKGKWEGDPDSWRD